MRVDCVDGKASSILVEEKLVLDTYCTYSKIHISYFPSLSYAYYWKRKGGGLIFRRIYVLYTQYTAKFASLTIINLHDCVLDHRKSACEDLPWHPSWPDYRCTSYHTTHSIHNQMILIPEEIRGLWYISLIR